MQQGTNNAEGNRPTHAPSRPLVSAAPAALAASALLALGACAPLNRDMGVGERVHLEAIEPDKAERAFPPVSPKAPDERSLARNTLDRSMWKARTVLIPIDGTTHRPTYATGPHYTSGTARQRGEFPSVDTVLEGDTRASRWDEVFEGLAWPFWAGADVALMPARMIAQPPWTLTESPAGPRARAPVGTGTPGRLGSPEVPPVSGLNATPSVPAIEEPRWIWRGGKWYLWVPGEPEPWANPQAPGAPSREDPSAAGADAEPAKPAKPQNAWIFKDGRWRKRDASDETQPKNKDPR